MTPLRVVVPLNDEHPNARPVQPDHLSAKEQPGVKVLPIAVVDIAGEKNKVYALVERLIDQPLKRGASRCPQALHGRTGIPVEAS